MRKVAILKHKRTFDYGKLDDFLDLIEPYCLRVTKEVLDLPPLNIVHRVCTMRGEQRKLYDQLQRDMVSSLPEITTPLKVSQVAKLAQITGGFVYDDNQDLWQVGHTKMRALKHILDSNLDRPTVIFAKYTAEVNAIAKLVSEYTPNFGILTGATKKKDRPNIIRDFQAGKTNYIICQQRTGGVGVDLYRGTLGIFYSVNFSYIDFEQAVARLHRRGQTSAVDITILVCKHSVDTQVMGKIYNKRKISSLVIDNKRINRRYTKSLAA